MRKRPSHPATALALPAASYPLTAAAVVASVGAGVFCLDLGSVGRTYRLHAERPGASLNERIQRSSWKGNEKRADLPSGAAHVISPVETASPLILVRISGPLEQRAGYHDPCSGWTDGHDAVAERLIAAFAEGDVLLVVDGPGGAAAGIEQNVSRVLAAKAEHGRRVTGFIDEQCASAHAWWMLAVCDEVFVPPQGTAGSIGARGEHTSIAGMLAQEGVVKTYFADPPEKVALAPEFPLSEVGAKRGNRDVSIAADMFRAAVCAGPVGLRYGLTPETLIALGADMLTGEACVGMFADGVETIETVTAYALGLAESGEAKAIEAQATGASRAAAKGTGAMTVKATHVRAEEPEKKEGDEDEPKSARGIDIPTKCAACSVENDKDAKFCKGCGESMATMAAEEEEPPSSRKGAAAHVAAPSRMNDSASLASILGATGDSPLAIKTAALNLRHVMDTARGITSKTEPAAVVGALLAIPSKLDRGAKARADLDKTQRKVEGDERWKLVHRLVKTGAVKRSKVLADAVNDDGTRATVDGKPAVRIRSMYADMPIGTLRTLVADLEADAPAVRRNPFEPSAEGAEAAAQNANPTAGAAFAPSDAQKAALAKHPDVQATRSRGSALTVDQLVTALVATNPQSARKFLAQNGAA